MPKRNPTARSALVMAGGSIGYLFLKALLPNTSWALADLLPALFIIFLGALVNALIDGKGESLRQIEEERS